MSKLIRKEVGLTPELLAAVEETAARLDRSLPWIVRKLITDHLSDMSPTDPVAATGSDLQLPTSSPRELIKDSSLPSENEPYIRGNTSAPAGPRELNTQDIGLGYRAPPPASASGLPSLREEGKGDCVGSPGGSPGDRVASAGASAGACVTRREGRPEAEAYPFGAEVARWAQVATDRINELMVDSHFEPDHPTQYLIHGIRRSGYTLDDILAVIVDRFRKIGTDPERRQWMAPATMFKGKLFSKYNGKVGMTEPRLGPLQPKGSKGQRRAASNVRRAQPGYYD